MWTNVSARGVVHVGSVYIYNAGFLCFLLIFEEIEFKMSSPLILSHSCPEIVSPCKQLMFTSEFTIHIVQKPEK